MSRKVTQVSPQTVVKHVSAGKRDTYWVSGFKIDKYAGSELQHISTDYLEPQEVRIELAEKSRWHNETSADRIRMVFSDPDKPVMTRGTAVNKGVKFFKTQEESEQFFLYAIHSMYKTMEPVLRLHSMFLDKLSHDCPQFVNEL